MSVQINMSGFQCTPTECSGDIPEGTEITLLEYTETVGATHKCAWLPTGLQCGDDYFLPGNAEGKRFLRTESPAPSDHAVANRAAKPASAGPERYLQIRPRGSATDTHKLPAPPTIYRNANAFALKTAGRIETGHLKDRMLTSIFHAALKAGQIEEVLGAMEGMSDESYRECVPDMTKMAVTMNRPDDLKRVISFLVANANRFDGVTQTPREQFKKEIESLRVRQVILLAQKNEYQECLSVHDLMEDREKKSVVYEIVRKALVADRKLEGRRKIEFLAVLIAEQCGEHEGHRSLEWYGVVRLLSEQRDLETALAATEKIPDKNTKDAALVLVTLAVVPETEPAKPAGGRVDD